MVEHSLEADKKLLCFHSSLSSVEDILLPNTCKRSFGDFLRAEHDSTGRWHTHVQQFLRCDENWYVNPSCIGFAYHWRRPLEEFRADPLAEYGLLTMAREQLGVEFRHNSFDVESMLEGVRNSGDRISKAHWQCMGGR